MSEVVAESLQNAPDSELHAMATYLKSLPPTPSSDAESKIEIPLAVLASGEDLYNKNCADCHGKQGEGRGVPGVVAAPALAGNRNVIMTSAVNPIRMVLFGGYAPGTAGNPRPFGMPPYSLTLSDEEIAEVLIYIRSSWGNHARPVQGEEVSQNRGSPLW
jgi:mono/diheme cytochrome c family protein